jgi:aminoglycoside phosphotransferase (APT) family kinase protein
MALLEEMAAHAPALPFGLPRVLDLTRVHDRWVSIEVRLPGRSMSRVLQDLDGEARAALVASYLDSAAALASIPIRRPHFGDLIASDAIQTATFRGYLERRARRSLDSAGGGFAGIDAGALARALPEASEPSLIYLDAHPDNMLVEAGKVSAVIDFGSATIIGERQFGAIVPATYLTERDQPAAQRWLSERGLSSLYEPTRRWIAAFWSFARDDVALFDWCTSVLLPQPLA